MFRNVFQNKRVLITGNTGFKGSWLTCWLLNLGAEVYGFANCIPTDPSMYKTLKLEQKIHQTWGDIRNFADFQKCVDEVKPDFLFHLAAQAIVSTSYKNPMDTITTNVIGTATVLEALRQTKLPITAVIITSDKAYDNVEWLWGYRENDRLGGKDIYSGSKGAAELVIKSYWHSFLKEKSNIKMGIARAGNVIGGGDWSQDRIVVDVMKAFSENRAVEIRSPKATRPWQHVLEPLSGYLTLAMALAEGKVESGEAFNFGPRQEITKTVEELVLDLSKQWNLKPEEALKVTDNKPFHEATLLKLNCDKALAMLKWHATLNYEQTIELVNEWYLHFYKGNNQDMYALTLSQIAFYTNLAEKGICNL
ncbi:MAG: CDP-glucose 4,6-dehydratase [Paludibacteraceae bacterium]|nr:CDP-glucose 4,6-dehydratase [Paludibacteraceae bacterium]